MLSDPKRVAAKEKRRATNVSSVTAAASAEKERAATINAVVKALQFSHPVPTSGGTAAVRFPSNGSNANISAALTGAAVVTQIFDHNGDPV